MSHVLTCLSVFGFNFNTKISNRRQYSEKCLSRFMYMKKSTHSSWQYICDRFCDRVFREYFDRTLKRCITWSQSFWRVGQTYCTVLYLCKGWPRLLIFSYACNLICLFHLDAGFVNWFAWRAYYNTWLVSDVWRL